MYDMYPWDDPSTSGGDGPPIPLRSLSLSRGDPSPQTRLVRAVQVALDRRDNGGDAVAAVGQPPAGQPAAASRPTASRTRQ